MMYRTFPVGPRTGELTGLQYLTSKPPPSDSGLRMSYFCTAMASEVLSWSTRCREVRRLRTPVAEGSLGLSGKTSKTPRPKISSRFVMVEVRVGNGLNGEVWHENKIQPGR